MSSVVVRFVGGTLEILNWPPGAPNPLPGRCHHDPRTRSLRSRACDYAALLLAFRELGISFVDEAKKYEEIELNLQSQHQSRSYQKEALSAWKKARGRGVIVLPTGAGKTHVAVFAISQTKRSTLVVAPTLELVRQWYDLLRASFNRPIGLMGGGDYDIQDITVSTYDSAYMHIEHLGNRFGLIVFDECHHLPSPSFMLIATQSIAPFRLGLTATPERSDGRHELLEGLIGPIVYRCEISELAGDYLADYQTIRISIPLSKEERKEYEEARAIYLQFLAKHGIRPHQPDGWIQFIRLASRTVEGQKAMAAYRRQRELAFCAPAKLQVVQRLLEEHRKERTLIFTEDNATCYAISRALLIPAITHQSKVRERSEILADFARGVYNAIVTSKVLNEGVDVPEASVAIVVSGSGSVREHVQRLGRILRKREGKFALLYELVTARTMEASTSERRRAHEAYH
ncbi:MAG: DEAD/DEAH box helicase family protein [Sandaracinaceae bacterium]|nr:DEAD/DEAH box helicase family protein [Sandaracinaceae bacterium]